MNSILNVWYSVRCTRSIKLVVCIATCLLIYGCSTYQNLSPIFILASLFLGVLTHIFQALFFHDRYKILHLKRLQLLGNAVVAGGLILIISFLPAPHRWILAIQVISFSGLGLFVVSIYQNRERRF